MSKWIHSRIRAQPDKHWISLSSGNVFSFSLALLWLLTRVAAFFHHSQEDPAFSHVKSSCMSASQFPRIFFQFVHPPYSNEFLKLNFRLSVAVSLKQSFLAHSHFQGFHGNRNFISLLLYPVPGESHWHVHLTCSQIPTQYPSFHRCNCPLSIRDFFRRDEVHALGNCKQLIWHHYILSFKELLIYLALLQLVSGVLCWPRAFFMVLRVWWD